MVSPIFKRYLLAVQRYKWAGLTCLLSIVGASGVVALQPPPPVEYYAEGTLVDNAPLVSLTNTADTIDQLGRGIISKDQLLSEVLLKEVSRQLGTRGIDLTPGEIRRNTTVTVSGGKKGETGLRADVSFIHADEETATVVLNTLFQGMVELSRVRNKARLQAIIDALNERLPPIETALRQAEQTLEQYDRQEGPAIQAALDGSLLGQISGSQQQIRQNEITLAGIDTQIRSLEQRLGLTADEAYVSSALSADPLIANLRAQIYQAENELNILQASDYREDHPIVVESLRNYSALQSQLSRRVNDVLSGDGQTAALPSGIVNINSNLDPARAGLANQLVNLQTERDTLISQSQVLALSARDLRQQYSSLPNKQLERERLAYQVGLKKALYDQIQARIVDAEAAEAETVSSLTVASPPTAVINEPEKPNPATILLIGGLLGLVSGGGIIFLLDMLDGTIRTPEDLEKLLRDQDMPILGAVPVIRTRPAKAAPILVQSDSQYHSSYERCLSKLRLTGFEDSVIGPRVVLVTSTISNEGKSITAYNLAIAAAQAGRRTLLVEADLRSGSKAQYLGLVNDDQVLMEPLRYYGGSIGDNVRMVPFVENLYVSPSPGPQRQAAAILESSEMRRFLDDARERFDMVILDTPSLSRVDDALLLEEQTDGMILVARPGVTERAVLNTALEELDLNEDIRLLGVLINGANVTLQDEIDDDDYQDDDERYFLEEDEQDTPREVATARIDF
ncbi:cobalamin biosynthesis protein CobQ [Leptolyngbyaceae cyanobacterium CCMR0082]|uniref:Cobalamin biosynthesis protein CobQ n=2 Tax=Adonisia turfae TaxID=2950184 RepID=A0A6M0S1Q9_9CYAN|nr:cobalamin biosynthesis protein CobQ [Adonisia turfae]MDV3350884.1 cobalamin biosynthesis protein CobQ [Leptothoe sp. LEGE 181152]NEZ60172.1 cobalamin biosynthesis protein CobQ [Adonisia turfae CCMR0081]NEZ61901.1 cobalamin biosynthesis protein CobQ [Adonisia turfae CCMR0082]